jgi:hypothetical protein
LHKAWFFHANDKKAILQKKFVKNSTKFLLYAKKASKNLLATLQFLPFAFHRSLMTLTPGVNFTNVSRPSFAPKAFCHKITNPNCKLIKAAQRALV